MLLISRIFISKTVIALYQPSGEVYRNIECVVDRTVSTDTISAPPHSSTPSQVRNLLFPITPTSVEIPQSDDHQLEPPSSDIGEFITTSPYTIGLLVSGPNGRDTPG